MRGAGRRKYTRKNKKVVKRGRKTVRSKTARKQRVKRTRSRRRIGGYYPQCSLLRRGCIERVCAAGGDPTQCNTINPERGTGFM